jgi:hypothetical protein
MGEVLPFPSPCPSTNPTLADEALGEQPRLGRRDGIGVQIELEDVGRRDQCAGARARERAIR